jgi:hypothetical protein
VDSTHDDIVPKPTADICKKSRGLIKECISTELTFVTELEWVKENFCCKFPEGIDSQTCAVMTSGIEDIVRVSKEFLANLQSAAEKYAGPDNHYNVLENIGNIFLKTLTHLRTPFGKNLRSYANASKIAREQTKIKLPAATGSLVTKLNNKLILPVQRCMRYCMLLQELLKRSKIRLTNTSARAAVIIKAYKAAKNFAAFCNTEELQGQSQILLSVAPKLSRIIKGQVLMTNLELCKDSKSQKKILVYLYNNGVLVQRTETNEIKAFDICAPNSVISQNFSKSKKSAFDRNYVQRHSPKSL